MKDHHANHQAHNSAKLWAVRYEKHGFTPYLVAFLSFRALRFEKALTDEAA